MFVENKMKLIAIVVLLCVPLGLFSQVPFLKEKYEVINLGKKVNSDVFEYAPTIDFDGRTVYFTSNRKGSYPFIDSDIPSHDIWKLVVSEDLTFSEPIHIENDTSKPNSTLRGLNSYLHEGTTCFSPDYTKLFIVLTSSGRGYGGNDIFITERSDYGWKIPELFSSNLSSKYSESMPTFVPDGSRFYFASNRPEVPTQKYKPKKYSSIWYCDYDFGSEIWEAPKLIKDITDSGNQEPCCALDDGKTLIFTANDIEPSYGAYDLYYTVYDAENDKWSEPVNLGEPINSEKDDRFFVISPTGEYAIFTSNRDGGEGQYDLYMVDLREINKP